MLFDFLFGTTPPQTAPAAEPPGERRASLENPAIPLSDPQAWEDTLGTSYLSDAGQSVTPLSALTLSPVWSGIDMIAGDLAKLPLEVYRRDNDGDEAPDYNHPAYDRINAWGMANEQISAFKLWRMFWESCLLWGNGWIWIDRGPGDRTIAGLYNLLPDRTTMFEHRGRQWVATEAGGELEVYPYDDVLHVRGLSTGGKLGLQLVHQARHDFGVALSSRLHKSKFFRSGLKLGGVLMVPPGTSKKAKGRVEKSIEEKAEDENDWFKTLVLRDGWKWQATSVDPKSAAMPEIDEGEARNVARWLKMPPSRLGIRDASSYNSLEQDKQFYFDTTLAPWLAAGKSEACTKLIRPSERRRRRRYVDYAVNALLWTDANTLSQILYRGVETGVADPDEVRRALFKWRSIAASGAKVRTFDSTPPAGHAAERSTLPTELRTAATAILKQSLARIRKRLLIQAAKRARAAAAANDTGHILHWVETIDLSADAARFGPADERRNVATCRAMAADAVELNRAAGTLDADTDPVDQLGAELRDALLALCDSTPLSELPAAMQTPKT